MYGVSWDREPWSGGRWSDHFAAAQEFDRQYAAADGVLRELAEALKGVHGVLATAGFADATTRSQFDVEELAGLTMPEALLLTASAGKAAPLAFVDREVTWACAKLDRPWDIPIELEPTLANAREVSVPWFTREIRRVGMEGAPHLEPAWRPGLGGPPPRTLEDGDEWRRATLVETLSILALQRGTRRTRPSDRAIAIASLLAGALEFCTVSELGDLSGVIEQERQAVIAVRRRRGFLATHRIKTRPNAATATQPLRRRQPAAKQVRTEQKTAFDALRAEYAASFGVAWDATPWGGPSWKETVAEAKRVDGRYEAARYALERVARALRTSREFLTSRNLSIEHTPHTKNQYVDAIVGRTFPEALLFTLWAAEHRALQVAEADLAASLRVLREQWDQGFADPADDTKAGRFDHLSLDEFQSRYREYLADFHRQSTNRGLRYIEGYSPMKELFARGWLPGLSGPPPRTTKNELEWRRAYLAQLLSSYFTVPGKGLPLPKRPSLLLDRSIAIVSLLIGGAGNIPRNLALHEIVAAERKAVALARKRRVATARENTPSLHHLASKRRT